MFAQLLTPALRRAATMLALALAITVASAGEARAHCDTMDGPVVTAARQSLADGKVAHVLIWVRAQDEAEVRSAFEHARSVRRLGSEARELADRYFFEAVVRLHRAGEGEPYTGLKPAGSDPGPAIPAADRALATGSVTELDALLVGAVRDGLRERFARALAAKGFPPDDVAAGRAYIAAYVPLLHYVEHAYALGAGEAHAETAAVPAKH